MSHNAGSGVSLPPEERGVGVVFQDYALFPHLTVEDNVAFGVRGEARDRRGECAMLSNRDRPPGLVRANSHSNRLDRIDVVVAGKQPANADQHAR